MASFGLTNSGKPKAPSCIHCGQDAVLHLTSDAFYQKDYGPVWVCADCDALVGCHPGTQRPMGTPANAEVRRLRSIVHKLFDVLWKVKRKRTGDRGSRGKAYAWFAAELGLAKEWCHISMFDAEICERAIVLLSPFAKKLLKRHIRREVGSERLFHG